MAVVYTDPDTNLDAISKSTNLDGWADELVAILKGVGAFLRAKESDTTAAEPDDHLAYIRFGDAASHNEVRIGYNGSNFVIDRNTGSEGTPAWNNALTLYLATEVLGTGAGGLILAGGLNCAGEAITNAASINGVSPTAHSSLHQPGGADPLLTAAPSNIGSALDAGSSNYLVRADHVHKGIGSVRKAGDTLLYGAVTLTGGSEITLTEAGQDISIAYDGHATIERTFATNTDVDQSIAAAATETAIKWDSVPNNLIEIPGADGAKDYKVSVFVNCDQQNTGISTFRIRRGTDNTTPANNTLLFEADWASANSSYGYSYYVGNFQITNPAAGQKLMFTIENTTANALTIYGAGTAPATRCCYVHIEEEH